MLSLRNELEQSSRFLIGCELASARAATPEQGARTRAFAAELAGGGGAVDWVSISESAGGNPQLAPLALGKPILSAGMEVVIHLTCKDLNRNGLESRAWLLHSEGFHNILAVTGDYPAGGSGGSAKPVFDIDSVGLISLLEQMNRGLAPARLAAQKAEPLQRTGFLVGAVASNSKLLEGEVMPQYAKLAVKVACGARFIVSQVNYDARKAHELRVYMNQHGMADIPLVGNAYLLNPRVARLFYDGKVPGIVVAPHLMRLCEEHGRSVDRGRGFFLELAAKQIAVYRGLGYRGVYLGGITSYPTLQRILELEQSFAPDDWLLFAREISFSRSGEFFFYAPDDETGLIDPTRRAPVAARRPRIRPVYRFSQAAHRALFTPGTSAARLGARLCTLARDSMQGPAPLRALERASKRALFGCRDCGDCSLPETAFLCPEALCPKNQRNGPCGGTRDGRCEVDGFGDCLWVRAYERLKQEGAADRLLAHAPVVQDQGLRGTSAWANAWLGRDHGARRKLRLVPGAPPDRDAGRPTPPAQRAGGGASDVAP